MKNYLATGKADMRRRAAPISTSVMFSTSLALTAVSSGKTPQSPVSTKPHPDTPDVGVSFTGLTRYAPVDTKNYLMLFGDFDGKTSVKDRELVINWNDGGKKDTVTFSYTCERKDGKVVTRTDVQLNHKDTTLPITFVR